MGAVALLGHGAPYLGPFGARLVLGCAAPPRQAARQLRGWRPRAGFRGGPCRHGHKPRRAP
eukprot:4586813-Lingulodinium_polyedra.AAC.1